MQEFSERQRDELAVLAVSPNPSEELKRVEAWLARIAKKLPLVSKITVLGDPELAVIGRYGLLIPFEIGGRRYSYQAIYLLDRRGVVVWKSIGSSTKWAEPTGLQAAIDRLLPRKYGR